MSSFTDRIRARTRRHNERQAQRAPQGRAENAFAPLGLEVGQVAAIQNALSDQSLEPVVHTPDPAPEQPFTSTPPNDQGAGLSQSASLPAAESQPVQPAAVSPVEPLAAPVEHAVAPTVARVEFKSSNVRAAELGADGVLLVTFADGEQYAYANFTPELFEEWQAAKSAGSWFHHNVRTKPDRHPVRKG
jgi:hypothetical protein